MTNEELIELHHRNLEDKRIEEEEARFNLRAAVKDGDRMIDELKKRIPPQYPWVTFQEQEACRR